MPLSRFVAGTPSCEAACLKQEAGKEVQMNFMSRTIKRKRILRPAAGVKPIFSTLNPKKQEQKQVVASSPSKG